MTKQQMKNKVSDLEWWLTNNPNHPNQGLVLRDKRELERKLALEQTDENLNQD